MEHLTTSQLGAALDHVRAAPASVGTLEMIACRPGVDQRRVLDSAVLDPDVGLVGDSWLHRGSRHTDDGSAEPDKQLNVMGFRIAELVARSRDRIPLAGDQLYLDLDLSVANLPAGSRLAIGDTAAIEVTPAPHNGCAKFTERFGLDAMRFVNSPVGKDLRLRGLCARVVVPGTISVGDEVAVTRPGRAAT
ncbi:MAG: MOSC domain-containing protein [Acidimicrobiales bacterium]